MKIPKSERQNRAEQKRRKSKVKSDLHGKCAMIESTAKDLKSGATSYKILSYDVTRVLFTLSPIP